jgi:hypothetical protein
MLNQCLLTGNLGADPEVFYNPEGNPVTSFNIAFHSSKKKTCWIKVVCFQKLAEANPSCQDISTDNPRVYRMAQKSIDAVQFRPHRR